MNEQIEEKMLAAFHVVLFIDEWRGNKSKQKRAPYNWMERPDAPPPTLEQPPYIVQTTAPHRLAK